MKTEAFVNLTTSIKQKFDEVLKFSHPREDVIKDMSSLSSFLKVNDVTIVYDQQVEK